MLPSPSGKEGWKRQRRPCSPADPAAGLVDGAPRLLMDQFGFSIASFFHFFILFYFFFATLPMQIRADANSSDRGGFKFRTRKCLDERSRAVGEDPQLLLHFSFSASLNIWPEPPTRPGPTAGAKQTRRGFV